MSNEATTPTSESTPVSDNFDAELSRMLGNAQPALAAPEEPKAPAEPVEEPAPVAAKAEEAPEPPKFAHKFTALAKKEQKLLEKERAIRAQEETIRQQAAQTSKLAAAMDKLGKDPIGALEALGVDVGSLYADLTEQSLSGAIRGRSAEAGPSKEELAALVDEKIKAVTRTLYEDKLQDQRQLAIAQTREIVASDPDRWAYIEANGVQDEVWNLIELKHQQEGVVLDFDEAADMIETYLEQEAQKYVVATERKKNRQAPQQATQQPTQVATKPAAPTTMTNAMSVKTPVGTDDQWESTVIDPKERAAYVLRELENLKF